MTMIMVNGKTELNPEKRKLTTEDWGIL